MNIAGSPSQFVRNLFLRVAIPMAVRAPRSIEDATVQSCVDAVRRIVRGLRLAEQATRADAGLSAAQLFVLEQVATTPGASLGELAARTMTDRTSVAAVVDRLVQGGYVETERDEADRRRVLVRITRAGRTILRNAPPAPTSQLVDALERLPLRARRELSARLEQLVAEMGLDQEPVTMLFEDAQTGSARER